MKIYLLNFIVFLVYELFVLKLNTIFRHRKKNAWMILCFVLATIIFYYSFKLLGSRYPKVENLFLLTLNSSFIIVFIVSVFFVGGFQKWFRDKNNKSDLLYSPLYQALILFLVFVFSVIVSNCLK